MGGLFTKSKKQSRVTEQDKAVLQLKQQRDRLKQYQKRIELSLENDRQLAKKCLAQGRKERAKLLLRKKKYQETMLANTDKQLENLEKMAADIEFAQVEMQVLEGLKQGNTALKKMHDILDINEIEKIMDETRDGIEKQQEIDAILSDALTQQDEDDVLAELEALEAEEDSKVAVSLPDVPSETLPEVEEEVAGDDEEVAKAKVGKVKEKPAKVLLEA
ncbi:charged multivesicular body protein 6-A [Musca domestica]|uniref:Charged multivesicular body protein 6-A n=1 Tax=Musca domestica TaxID=7370 RepID=A0A1I8MAN6_MUSDO|nr:charged multivesicular body protein 6-A [Musca domestica]XP_058986871.1 charged multivesicular body protein 6-A [Musca domestica]